MIAFPSPLVFIRNLKITARLVTLSSFLLLLVIGVVLLGHIGLSTQTAQMDSVYRDHTVPLSELGLGLDGLHRSRMRIVLAMETQYMNTAEEHFAEMEKLQTEAIKNLKSAFTGMTDPESQKQIKAFDENSPPPAGSPSRRTANTSPPSASTTTSPSPTPPRSPSPPRRRRNSPA